MNTQQMKKLQTGDVLVDNGYSGRDVVLCIVCSITEDGIIVSGFRAKDRSYYYDKITERDEELIPWNKAGTIDVIDAERLSEPGYLI